jgi:hypothetical protein
MLAQGKHLIANVRQTKTTLLKATRIKEADEVVELDVKNTVIKIIKQLPMLQNETGCILKSLMSIAQYV